jgi:hypothetical protein
VLETIVTANGYTVGSAYSDLPSKTFTTVKDELGIVGTAQNDGAQTTNFNHLTLTDGTYNIEITAVSGSTTRVISYRAGVGTLFNDGGSAIVTFTNNKSYSGDGTVSSTLTLPSFPDSLGSVTIDDSTNAKGLMFHSNVTNGGHTAGAPSVTFRITAT